MPCLNEEENLPIISFLIFEMARENKLDVELIIVEDNSKDNTRKVLEQLKKFYKEKLKVILRPRKMGLGSAYMEGFKSVTGNHVIIMDADLSHHPKYIP